MNQNQRDNLAKFLYDISKIIFTVSVISNLFPLKLTSIQGLVAGTITGLFFLGSGLLMDGFREKEGTA